jgi:hypothetical protein
VNGKTLITCNASNGRGGTDFYRKIKKGTVVNIVDANVPSPEGLEDRGGEVSFTVPGYPSIVETWRHDLIEIVK